MQALITEPVIDRALRVPQFALVLTHDDIREELVRQLDAGKLVAADVARKLGIAAARVTEMKKGERRVQQAEMPVLAAILGLSEGAREKESAIESVAKVPYLGKVAQGVWLEESFLEPDPEDREYVSYDREPGDPAAIDLFAVKPEGTSMKLAFPDPRTRLICRRIVFGVGELKDGDFAIIERKAHDLHELTCKQVRIDDQGVYWLHSRTDDERFKEPWRIGKPSEDHHTDVEITFVAKVIRSVVDYDDTN